MSEDNNTNSTKNTTLSKEESNTSTVFNKIIPSLEDDKKKSSIDVNEKNNDVSSNENIEEDLQSNLQISSSNSLKSSESNDEEEDKLDTDKVANCDLCCKDKSFENYYVFKRGRKQELYSCVKCWENRETQLVGDTWTWTHHTFPGPAFFTINKDGDEKNCDECNIELDRSSRDAGLPIHAIRCNNCYWEDKEGKDSIHLIKPDYREKPSKIDLVKLCENVECERYPPDWDFEEDTEDTYQEGQWKKCCLCDGYYNDDGFSDILFVQEEPNNQEAECDLCGKTKDIVQMKGTGQYLCEAACDESDEDDE